MSTTKQSPNDKEGSGGLKLKIKFSKSRGFISDFVDADTGLPDANAAETSCSTSSARPQSVTKRDQDPVDETRIPPKELSAAEVGGGPLSDCHVCDDLTSKGHVCENLSSGQTETESETPGVVFLSSPQDEVDGGRDSFHGGRHSKQHMTAAPEEGRALDMTQYGDSFHGDRLSRQHVTAVLDMAQQGLSNSGKRHEGGRQTPEAVVDLDSEEESMSPFDINCNLGLDDEVLMCSKFSLAAGKHAENAEKQMEENPLFPWSVVGSTEPRPYYPVHQADHSASVPTGPNRLENSYDLNGVSSTNSVFHAHQTDGNNHSENTGGLHTVNEQGHPAKRLFVVDCRTQEKAKYDQYVNEKSVIFPPKSFYTTSILKPLPTFSTTDSSPRTHSSVGNGESLLLSGKDRVANTLQGPVTDSFSLSEEKTPVAMSQRPHTLPQLSCTVAELMKRVGNGVPPGDSEIGLSNTETTEVTDSLQDTLACDSVKSIQGDKVIKKRRPNLVWCRCDTPIPKDFYKDSLGKCLSMPDICLKCCKKLSKKWIIKSKWNPSFEFPLSTNSVSSVSTSSYWCRCQKPLPHVPGGGIFEVCKKCSTAVSKSWKKAMASKWCKCEPPLLCRLEASSAMKVGSKPPPTYECFRCLKMVDSDKEKLADHLSSVTLNASQIMDDHSYSLPYTQMTEKEKHPTNDNDTLVQPCCADVQNNGEVQVYRARLVSALASSVASATPVTLTAQQDSSSGEPSAGNTLCLSDINQAISAHSQSQKKRDPQSVAERPCPKSKIKKKSLLLDTGVDVMTPCFVVLEKMDENSEKAQTRTRTSVCSASCRQRALGAHCMQGKLKHCLYHSTALNQHNSKRIGVFKKKRNLFKQHQTLKGYEEYRQKQLGLYRQKHKKQETSDNLPSGFVPLSTFCATKDDTTHLRISSKSEFSSESARLKRKQKIVPRLLQETDFSFYTNEDPLSSKPAEKVLKEKSKTKELKATELPGLPHNTSRGFKEIITSEEPNGPMKMSKLNVKYYVFQSGDRAFVVPIIKKSRYSKRLDEEDLGYVKVAIRQFLAENHSCARLLGYPDSLQHKSSGRSVSQVGCEEEASSTVNKQAFVAPTLGAESLDLESLTSLISDKDFSRLVPKDSRLSKSKYLQQIGEKVHMYLTGGSEESPDWIKDVAKSIVMKQRSQTTKKASKRLRPSKNFTIEIDYAMEEEFLDVGEEETLHQSTSYDQSAACGAVEGDKRVNQTSFHHQEGFAPQISHTFQQSGSYVCQEAYTQEETKPLLGELMGVAPGDSVAGAVGQQQIMVPLPQPDDSAHSAGAWYPFATASMACSEGSESVIADRKPLLCELLASSLLPQVGLSQEQVHGNQELGCSQMHQEEQLAENHPSEQELAVSCAIVKQEPVDEDYSHAWENQAQFQNAAETPSVPFISNSTFGTGVMQLGDEPGVTAVAMEHCSGQAPLPAVKMEPVQAEMDTQSQISVPFITGIYSMETSSFCEKLDVSSTPSTGDGQVTGRTAEQTDHHFFPQNTSIAFGDIATCTASLVKTEMPFDTAGPESVPFISNHTFGRAVVRLGDESRCVTPNQVTPLEAQNVKIEPFDPEYENTIPVPQITCVTSGEAAKFWEHGDEPSTYEEEVPTADCNEMPWGGPEAGEGKHCLVGEVEIPVISSVAFGDAAAHLENSLVDSEHLASSEGYRTVTYQDDEDDYADDFEGGVNCDDEQTLQDDITPIVCGSLEGQVISVPLSFPTDPLQALETTVGARADCPTVHIGVDLSIVKQEPVDIEEPVTSSFSPPADEDSSECQTGENTCVPINASLGQIGDASCLPSHHIVGKDIHAETAGTQHKLSCFEQPDTVKDVSSVSETIPLILDVCSLAPLVPHTENLSHSGDLDTSHLLLQRSKASNSTDLDTSHVLLQKSKACPLKSNARKLVRPQASEVSQKVLPPRTALETVITDQGVTVSALQPSKSQHASQKTCPLRMSGTTSSNLINQLPLNTGLNRKVEDDICDKEKVGLGRNENQTNAKVCFAGPNVDNEKSQDLSTAANSGLKLLSVSSCSVTEHKTVQLNMSCAEDKSSASFSPLPEQKISQLEVGCAGNKSSDKPSDGSSKLTEQKTLHLEVQCAGKKARKGSKKRKCVKACSAIKPLPSEASILSTCQLPIPGVSSAAVVLHGHAPEVKTGMKETIIPSENLPSQPCLLSDLATELKTGMKKIIVPSENRPSQPCLLSDPATEVDTSEKETIGPSVKRPLQPCLSSVSAPNLSHISGGIARKGNLALKSLNTAETCTFSLFKETTDEATTEPKKVISPVPHVSHASPLMLPSSVAKDKVGSEQASAISPPRQKVKRKASIMASQRLLINSEGLSALKQKRPKEEAREQESALATVNKPISAKSGVDPADRDVVASRLSQLKRKNTRASPRLTLRKKSPAPSCPVSTAASESSVATHIPLACGDPDTEHKESKCLQLEGLEEGSPRSKKVNVAPDISIETTVQTNVSRKRKMDELTHVTASGCVKPSVRRTDRCVFSDFSSVLNNESSTSPKFRSPGFSEALPKANTVSKERCNERVGLFSRLQVSLTAANSDFESNPRMCAAANVLPLLAMPSSTPADRVCKAMPSSTQADRLVKAKPSSTQADRFVKAMPRSRQADRVEKTVAEKHGVSPLHGYMQSVTGNTSTKARMSSGASKNLFDFEKDNEATIKNRLDKKEKEASEIAKERSFFDCLPQGLMDAWKT